MLPEDRLDDVLDYLAEESEGDESLSAETHAGIEEGLDASATGERCHRTNTAGCAVCDRAARAGLQAHLRGGFFHGHLTPAPNTGKTLADCISMGTMMSSGITEG